MAKYIPEFAQNGKEEVTIRQLLTHYSGLRPDLDLKQYWSGLDEGYSRANAEKLINPPGSTFVYSDINFVVLGELVQRVSWHAARSVCADIYLRSAGHDLDALSSAARLDAAYRADRTRRAHGTDAARRRA